MWAWEDVAQPDQISKCVLEVSWEQLLGKEREEGNGRMAPGEEPNKHQHLQKVIMRVVIVFGQYPCPSQQHYKQANSH